MAFLCYEERSDVNNLLKLGIKNHIFYPHLPAMLDMVWDVLCFAHKAVGFV
jgi:hypothetical protein